MKYYTGIGSRKTPTEILNMMTRIAMKLEKEGYILRSGGAEGADKAFERGVKNTSSKNIYYANDATPEAMLLASTYHPAWDRCSDYAKKLHGRNCFQILGRDLKAPSKFVICWTPDGCTNHKDRTIQTGGTGTAISIADYHQVEVFNLTKQEHFDRLSAWLNKGE